MQFANFDRNLYHQCYQPEENYLTVFGTFTRVEVEWQLTSSTASFSNHTASSHTYDAWQRAHTKLCLPRARTLPHAASRGHDRCQREASIFSHETEKHTIVSQRGCVCLQNKHKEQQKGKKKNQPQLNCRSDTNAWLSFTTQPWQPSR